MMKPLETVFTTRMKERLSKRPDMQDKADLAHVAANNSSYHSLPVVKYDLSTPDNPPFQLDCKPELKIRPVTVKAAVAPLIPVSKIPEDVSISSESISPSKTNHNREKSSKHKHKHSSKKKSKKLVKDLEDGEII